MQVEALEFRQSDLVPIFFDDVVWDFSDELVPATIMRCKNVS